MITLNYLLNFLLGGTSQQEALWFVLAAFAFSEMEVCPLMTLGIAFLSSTEKGIVFGPCTSVLGPLTILAT